MAAMVLDKLEADSPSKGQMNEVLAAAERAAVLTKRLLAFSRKQVAEVKPINVNETVMDLQKMLVRIIGEDIDFQLDLEDRSLVVMADAGQIEQVLMNLASNARDAMPEGGRLTISTGLQEMDDEYVAVNGYGSPECMRLSRLLIQGTEWMQKLRRRYSSLFLPRKVLEKAQGSALQSPTE